MKQGYITLEKADQKQKEFKSYINEIIIGSKKNRKVKKYNKKY